MNALFKIRTSFLSSSATSDLRLRVISQPQPTEKFQFHLPAVLEEDNPNDVQISKFVKRVPNDKRKIIFEALLNYNVEGKVRHGAIRDVARNVGRKRIQINPDEVSRIPLNRHITIRSMATALNMSKTSLHRRVKEGSLKSHSNAINPL
nr:Transposase, Tc1-like protein [Ipomoea batatas]